MKRPVPLLISGKALFICTIIYLCQYLLVPILFVLILPNVCLIGPHSAVQPARSARLTDGEDDGVGKVDVLEEGLAVRVLVLQLPPPASISLSMSCRPSSLDSLA